MVIVRLMTYSIYPIVYRDSHEQDAKAAIKNALNDKLDDFIKLFDDPDKLYNYDNLHSNLKAVSNLLKGFISE